MEIKNEVIKYKSMEVDELLEKYIKELEDKGFRVDFGKIGVHTTYALLTNIHSDEEIVGYTFIKDMKYYRENVGKLKALQQAIARMNVTKEKRAN